MPEGDQGGCQSHFYASDRLIVCGLLVWAVLRSSLDLWVIGLMLLVMLMNLSGILPLASELKKQRAVWKQLLEEEE